LSYDGPRNAKSDVSLARPGDDLSYGKLAEIESLLTNRVNHLTDCNDYGKNNSFMSKQVYNKPVCTKKLISEDTRFTFPLENYRSMSITSHYLQPYLPVNPQCIIQANRDKLGSMSRLIAKDSYKIPTQQIIDQGQALPPL
jgi:hypothetical protein